MNITENGTYLVINITAITHHIKLYKIELSSRALNELLSIGSKLSNVISNNLKLLSKK